MNYKKLIVKLNNTQKKELLTLLKRSLVISTTQEVSVCPCCKANNFIKHGSYNGTPKYKCKNTNKIFTYRTNTVLSGLVKHDQVIDLLEMLSTGRLPTITEIQKRIGISRQTAFDWRTKILTALFSVKEITGQIIEFDEAFYRLSRKGRRGMKKKYARKRGKGGEGDNRYTTKVFVSYSRTSNKLNMELSHIGVSTYKNLANYFCGSKPIIVYTDKHRAYPRYFNEHNITHESFFAIERVSRTNRSAHNQSINYYSGQLDTLVNRNLRGVSTKYLQGYCNWVNFINNTLKKDVATPVEATMNNKVAHSIFKQKEEEFKYLLRNNNRTNHGTCRNRYATK